MGFKGIVRGAIITAYFGAVINKAVLEIYREVSEKQREKPELSSGGPENSNYDNEGICE